MPRPSLPANTSSVSLVVLIPTRNRADLAICAIDSALGDGRLPVQLVVSDNSTDKASAAALGAYCAGLGPRVTYIRPPDSMAMAEHWDWAIETTLDRVDASHLTILTDRFLFRPGAVVELAQVAAQHPDSVINFRYDDVYDHVQPSVVALSAWSGRTVGCRSEDLLRANSTMTSLEFVPVPLHSLFPRRALATVKQAFGDYCVSVAPDFACGFRALAVEDEIVVFDKGLSINWGRKRSNGFAYTLGKMQKDSSDFAAMLGTSAFCSATPFPEVTTVGNVIAHEYLCAREAFGGCNKFPEIDRAEYVRFLLAEIEAMEDAEMRNRFRERVAGEATSPETRDRVRQPWDVEALPTPRGGAAGFREMLVSERTRPFWWMLVRLGIASDLPWRLSKRFDRGTDARDYALRFRGEHMADGRNLPRWMTASTRDSADREYSAGSTENLRPGAG